MSIQTNSFKINFVRTSLYEIRPLYFFQMPLLVITSNLKIASVFPKTKGEHSLLNQIIFLHHFKDWSHMLARVTHRQPQNSISLLSIEEIVLWCHTAKCEIECIRIGMMVFAKVDQVSDNETCVRRPLPIALTEKTLVSLVALESIRQTLEEMLGVRKVNVQVVIDMIAALLAVILTGKGCYSWPSVCNEGLRLALRTDVDVDIEVLELGTVAIQGSWLEMHMPHSSGSGVGIVFMNSLLKLTKSIS